MRGTRTVRVPAEMERVFQQAERLVAGYFATRRERPERGSIEISGERYLLVRAASLSVEFFALVRELYGPGHDAQADEFSRNLLYDLSHGLGRADARHFHARMGLTDPVARLAAGPVHFSHTGWAFVDIDPRSCVIAGPEYVLLYEHPHSFEADAWLASGTFVDAPACIMNSGYSAGWCQESFGLRLVSAEVACRACGDSTCRFVMAPPDRIERRLEEFATEPSRPASRRRPYGIPDLVIRKRIEDELYRAREELEQRVRERTAELERANRRLREEIAERERVEAELVQAARLEAVGRVAGGIAHDFNNLLAVVIGQASLLERQLPEGSAERGMAGEIRSVGQEAAQLTTQLMGFGRAGICRVEPLDLNEVVRANLGVLHRLIGERIVVVTDLTPDDVVVRMDRGQLAQVVMNLVINARDAMPDGGTLTVRTAVVAEPASAPQAVLEVTDTGSGMDEETVARVFDPFFSTKPGGTGLGLATVRRVVTGAGGSIEVESRPGAGSTFRIRLPRAPETRQPCRDGAPGTARAGEAVLVVEDQPPVRRMMVRALERLGYVALEADTPEAALRLLSAGDRRVDLLITDVVMPGMNGPELAARAVALHPALKVLFVSGYPDDALLRDGVEAGRMELLAKPFLAEQLAARVRRILDT
ncbi:MAG: response regulator [Myxococcales bacterium]|nr:response regulator [Myxococcales bacterium]